MKLLFVLAFIGAAWYAMEKTLYTWLPTNYAFDQDTLHAIANRVIATHNSLGEKTTTEALLKDVRDELALYYGDDYINKYVSEEWVFNNAGGAMGQMLILHASFSEYLILFGTAVGNEGHSGVHFADDYFTILKGTQYASLPYNPSPEIYTAGMMHHMKKGEAKQYGMARESFALEYARGWIPCMLPFGFLDTFTSTLDFYTLYRTVYLTGRDMLKNLVVNKKF
ncbi:LANO_0A02454g1_1 [Lachancea nothofagi CBS 11611]|uniref:C-8 sterol isomerase n=1 Tax=Lachancea nothofagi CBS 11611 TaxID=1266666 RepID=A0A1G4INK4_9SACH|nr:LANO_0A02454g1_1 [Lachancea nothofagi CBS 11611]